MQGPLAGKSLSDVETDSFVTKFSVDESSNCFHLEDKFRLSLSSGSEFIVNFDEQFLWNQLYTHKLLTEEIGREGCFILDFAFNSGGSEALAETYFGIMKHQYKDNSLVETAGMRTIVSYCMPDVSRCPNAVSEIEGQKALVDYPTFAKSFP